MEGEGGQDERKRALGALPRASGRSGSRRESGERGFFYIPGGVLKRGAYIPTVKEGDGDNDKAANLNRDGVSRVNRGVRNAIVRSMFGEISRRPAADGVVDME